MIVKGKITKSENEWIGGPEAGPRYNIEYEYEFEGKKYKGKRVAEFDGLHLAYGKKNLINLKVGAEIELEIDENSPEESSLDLFEKD